MLIGLARDSDFDGMQAGYPVRERLAEPVGVVALVAEQLLRGRQRIDHHAAPL